MPIPNLNIALLNKCESGHAGCELMQLNYTAFCGKYAVCLKSHYTGGYEGPTIQGLLDTINIRDDDAAKIGSKGENLLLVQFLHTDLEWGDQYISLDALRPLAHTRSRKFVKTTFMLMRHDGSVAVLPPQHLDCLGGIYCHQPLSSPANRGVLQRLDGFKNLEQYFCAQAAMSTFSKDLEEYTEVQSAATATSPLNYELLLTSPLSPYATCGIT